MSTLFSYFEGCLEDFLTYIKEINDNRLVKIRLASVESFYHVLDNFAVQHIVTKHSNDKVNTPPYRRFGCCHSDRDYRIRNAP